MFTHDIDPADGCGRLVRPRLAEFSDRDLDGCVRLGVDGPAAEFYSPDQPCVPGGYPAGGQWMDVGGHEYHVRDRAGRIGKTLKKFETAEEAARFVETGR